MGEETMHRRQLFMLYAILVLAAVLLGWRLVGEWRRANMRYNSALRRSAAASSVYLPTSFPQAAGAPPTVDIVAKNLFSPERNNDIALEEKSQPAPPVPIVFGTINLGGSYEALMADKGPGAGPGFRRVKKGERLGGYTVVEISDEKVVIEFQGKKTTLDVYQSANSVPRAETRTAPAAAPVVVSGTTAPPQPAAPAQPAGVPAPAAAAAQPGLDPDVKVTIEGNRRKFERPSMFGPMIWYEDIPPK
jgi:hypothetical protein